MDGQNKENNMGLPTNQLSKLRRYMQGAGVDFRRRSGIQGVDNDPNIGTRTLVPGLLDDSMITAITLQDETSGILSDGESLFLPFVGAETDVNDDVANAGLVYTAIIPQPVRLRYVDTNVASDPLVVTVDNVAGVSRISVQLAQSDAAVITSTAALVRAAVLQHPEASKLVNVAFAAGNDGTGIVTAVAEFVIGTDPDGQTSAAVAGYNNKQGATYSHLHVTSAADVDGNVDNDLELEGQVIGSQTALTFAIASTGADQALSVAFVSPDIVVETRTVGGLNKSTAAEIAAAINAHAGASAVVRARVAPTYGGKGDGIMADFAQTLLVLGQEAGIVLTGDNATGLFIVEWYDRRNAGENAHAF